MSYATTQDMIDRFGADELIELTDRANLGQIDATVLARALADADAEINGYLVSRYQLPLPTIPPVLTRIAADLARYAIYDDRATERITGRRNDAVQFLQSLAKGTVSLGLDPLSVPVTDAAGVQIISNERIFCADSLADY